MASCYQPLSVPDIFFGKLFQDELPRQILVLTKGFLDSTVEPSTWHIKASRSLTKNELLGYSNLLAFCGFLRCISLCSPDYFAQFYT